MSRPVRARGLKLCSGDRGAPGSGVAPRTGAWIETRVIECILDKKNSSRPVRARGLKQNKML